MAKSIKQSINLNEEKKIIHKEIFFERYAWYFILSFSIITLLLRLYRLDYQSLWVDEYVHADAARNFLDGNGHFWGNYELNQLLVNVFNSLFTWCFGYSDFVLRLPIALFSILGIPAIYLLGKKLFNNPIGLIAAFLFSFSQYFIFWARIDRAYGLIPAFYLWTLYFFFCMIEDYHINLKQNKFFHHLQLHYKFFLYFIAAFLISFLTQIQVFLFLYTAGFYSTCVFINRYFDKVKIKKQFTDFYAILTYLNVIGIIILFVPFFSKYFHQFVEVFLPSHMADLIVPKVENIIKAFNSENRFKNFLTYVDVTTNDLTYFYWLGWAGLVFSFFLNRKSSFYLNAGFIVPVLLMGFVLREPNLAKYMSFYYPLFFISGSVSLYFIYNFISKKIKPHFQNIFYRLSFLSLLALFYLFIPFNKIKHFLTTNDYENVLDFKLSEISFPVWKKYIEYILMNKKEGDIILTTLPGPLAHYLKIYEDTYNTKETKYFQFRQQVVDFINKRWKPYPISEEQKKQDHANSYDGLLNLYKKYNRAWLIADYYFNKSTSDPNCVFFCIQNMHYHLNAGDDGSIRIMHWDKNDPLKHRQSLLIELGKPYNDPSSKELFFDIPKKFFENKHQITIQITYEGIERPEEVVFRINNKNINIPIQPNIKNINGIEVNVASKGPQKITFAIDPRDLKEGQNMFQFFNGIQNDGFVIYELLLIG